MMKLETSSLLDTPSESFLAKKIYAFILCLFVCLTGCARYRPNLLISYTQEGKGISVQRLVEGAFPTWSPDGKRIAYQDHGIRILDLETKRKRTFSQAGSNPSWSPDGKRIAYANNGIWIWESKTDTHKHLSKTGSHPCWFPDSDSLVFNNHDGIWRLTLDGSKKTKLLDKGIPLSFSPDGSSLLVEIWQPDRILFTLALLDISTGELGYLLDGTKGSFAPDGYSIVYSFEGLRIYSMVKNDSTGIVLDGYDPEWSPVGDHIVFYARGSIWLIDAPYKPIIPGKGE